MKNGRFEGETSEAEVNGVFQQGATPVDPLSRFLIIDFRLFPSRTRHGSNGEVHPMFFVLTGTVNRDIDVLVLTRGSVKALATTVT